MLKEAEFIPLVQGTEKRQNPNPPPPQFFGKSKLLSLSHTGLNLCPHSPFLLLVMWRCHLVQKPLEEKLEFLAQPHPCHLTKQSHSDNPKFGTLQMFSLIDF